MNQDARDAIGAAITAKLYSAGRTESFGEIVVPLPATLGQMTANGRSRADLRRYVFRAELHWGNKWGNMPHRFQPIST
jgi:hypothetical protein